MIRQTSLEAFWALDDINTRQQEVLGVIRSKGPISNLEIAEELQKPINSITPRTNELVAKGLVEEAYRAPSIVTGRKVIHWRAR